MAVEPAEIGPATHSESSWNQVPSYAARRRSRAIRVSVGVLLIGALAVWLAIQLGSPLLHPNTSVVSLSGADYDSFQVPPLTFWSDDERSLESLNPTLYPRKDQGITAQWNSLGNAQQMPALFDKIADLDITSRDVLILFVYAHGISDEGTAYLLCGNFGVEQPSRGRWSVPKLIEQVQASDARVKLLVMNCGGMLYDPRLGILVNEFPQLLAKSVEESGDEKLWVFMGSSALESSFSSLALQQSMFSFFTVQALRGAADLNSDMNVDLDELYRYVSANVSSWVAQNTGGLGSQTPRLVWGGGDHRNRARIPILISVQPFEKPVKPSNGKTQKIARQAIPKINIAEVMNSAEKRSPTIVFPAPQGRSAQTPEQRIGNPGIGNARVTGESNNGSSPGTSPSSDSTTSSHDSKGGSPSSKAATNNGQANQTNMKVATSVGRPASSGSGSSKSNQATKKADEDPAALLVEGWQTRDQMIQERQGASMLDLAPQLLRAYERTLLGYEKMLRRGGGNRQQIAAGLASLVVPLRKLDEPTANIATGNVTTQAFGGSPNLAERMLAIRSASPLPPTSIPSLGLAIKLSATGHSSPLLTQAAEFDRVFDSGTRAEAEAWLKKAAADGFDQYLEVQFAAQLIAQNEVDWSLVKRAVQTRRFAEQAAASWCAMWTKEKVDKADGLRMRGELELFYRIGEGWQQRAEGFFDQAMESYQSAQSDNAILGAAKTHRDLLLHSAPYYLRWRAIGARSLQFGPDSIVLAQLLDTLGQFASVLEHPDPSQIVNVERIHHRLVTLRSTVESAISPTEVSILLGGAVAAGDVYRVDSLLATPLVAAEQRVRLLNYASHADKVMAGQIRLPYGVELKTQQDLVTPNEWQWILSQLELEIKLVELGNLKSSQTKETIDRLSLALRDAKRALEHYTVEPESVAARETLWIPFRQAGQQLSEYYAGLPKRVETEFAKNSDLSSFSNRSAERSRLNSVLRAMYLVDGRDAQQIDQVNPRHLLRQAELYDLLVWNIQRTHRLRSESPPFDVAYFDSAARQFREAAGQLPNQPAVAPYTIPTLKMAVLGSFDLALKDSGVILVNLSSLLGDVANVWLSADYDRSILDLSSDVHHPLADNRLPITRRHLDDSATPTARIAPGVPEIIRLRVNRKRDATEATRIVLSAVTPTEVVRSEIEVLLPQADPVGLQVSGTPSSWSNSSNALELFPFPNRVTQFQLGLVNRTKQPLTCDVSLLAPEFDSGEVLPRGAIPAQDADQLLTKFGDSQVLADVKKLMVPADGSQVLLPFPKLPTAADTSAKTNANPQGDAAAPKSGSAAAKPTTPPMSQPMLLLVVTNTANATKSIWPIRIQPQRPRRFLKNKVSYSLAQETFTIRVGAKDASSMPAEGVKVTCHVVDAASNLTLLQLTGVVKAPGFEALMNASVPADGRRVTIRLDIDGYPRAFNYQYVCNGDAASIPEASSLLDARITKPTAGTAFAGNKESIDAHVEIDAPLDAFDDPTSVVEVGIDQQRDRDLRNDAVVTLRSDRDVQISVDRLTSKGTVAFETHISDFDVQLPVVGSRNNRANVLALVHAGTRTARSEPVEVVFDSTAPTIGFIQLKPEGFITAGEAAILTIECQDTLSGVKQVQAAIDVDRANNFSTTVKPVNGAQQPNGSWVVQLPTSKLEAGNYHILVQATDNVGNSSPFRKIEITVLSKEQAAARIASMVVDVTGTVTYGEQGQEGIEVSLTKPSAPAKTDKQKRAEKKKEPQGTVVAKTMTDAKGNFVFRRVGPGEYQVFAEGIVRNKVRKASSAVVVKPGKPPQTIELKLPPN